MDLYNLFRKLTVRKVYNFILTGISFFLSAILKRDFHWGYPPYLAIEPTSSCNLKCPECPAGTNELCRGKGDMNDKLFNKILDESYHFITYLTLYFQGEPFLNNRFIDMVKEAAGRKIYTATSTNGNFLTDENVIGIIESGLDKLIISVDGTTQEVYEKYRVGGNLDTVISGIKNLLKWKRKMNSKKPYVVISFLALRTNLHQIEDIKILGRKLGVDKVVIKTAQVKNLKKMNRFVPLERRMTRYKLVNGHYELKKKLVNRCWRAWSSPVITYDGQLVPCCFDKDAEYSMGELSTNNLSNLWTGNNFKDFRLNILKNRAAINMCRNCTNAQKIF